ncbi:MAG TPA: antibiotic biosynthesis monooxygenase [Xanthomonadales bacterium]|nr:antibiotic biosynthesis monooxygenase [Xanthomonadales bacterium]
MSQVVFIATLNVAAGKEADFERLQTELSKISHEKEPGLLVYDVIRHTEKPGVYVVYARFRDKEAFDFHQEADFHHRLVPPILECVEGEMDLQFFDWVA